MQPIDLPTRGAGASRRTTRILAAFAAASITLTPLAAAPLMSSAAAQTSVLEQVQGGPAASPRAASPGPRGDGESRGGGAQAILNPRPNWNAPGIRQGATIISWARAGALVLAVLSLVLLVPLGKFLKSAGNHHAEGVRSGVSGALGIAAISGMGASLVLFIAG